jgi:hypothetical protein
VSAPAFTPRRGLGRGEVAGPYGPGYIEVEEPERRRRRVFLLLLALFLWLPSACTVVLNVDLYERSVPDGRAFFVDPSVEVTPGTLRATGLVAMHLMPGDQAVAGLQLTNHGVVPLRISMMTSPVEPGEEVFAGALQATVRLADADCTAATGTVLFEGRLADATFGRDGLGAGPDALIPAADHAVLCLDVRLPWSTDNASQGLSSRLRFVFAAEVAS